MPAKKMAGGKKKRVKKMAGGKRRSPKKMGGRGIFGDAGSWLGRKAGDAVGGWIGLGRGQAGGAMPIPTVTNEHMKAVMYA